MLPKEIKAEVERELGAEITAVQRVGGGSINEAAKIETATGAAFIKWNDAKRFPGMFAAEVKGLQLLRQRSTFHVPAVIAQKEEGDVSFLLLEFIERSYTNWKTAGTALANMHRQSNELFGLDHANYIGSLRQVNTQHSSWSDFFANERILQQVDLAVSNQLLTSADRVHAENFCKRMDELFPREAPALLHGDLWSGNFMFTTKGPSVYDPAVYYGHREMDIAMSKLFGGFHETFYEVYNEVFPLEKNWEQRVRWCNLYPLLVHVNLFGGGYVREAQSILSAF